MIRTLKTFCLVALLVLSMPAWAQHGDRVNRRSAILNGNQVRTVFGNWGVIGQPAQLGHRGAWKYDNNGYLGDVSPFIGAEAKYTWPNPAGHTAPDTLFRSVETCPISRPATHQDEDPNTGIPWTFEPLPGYFGDPPNQSVALSNNKKTWPTQWPDKLSDATDPGWSGKWNGYFGKRASADLETYFVMDDNDDHRYNVSTNNRGGVAFQPDSRDPTRNGLGFEVRVRALQWAQFLAKDNIFWLYEITNTGTSDYARAVFGLLVGTYVGCSSTDDSPQEYNDDWSFYDAPNNLTYTGDFKRIQGLPMKNPLWTGPVGMVGYAFLESPGNPYDGIDNDGDADSSTIGRSAPQFSELSFQDTSIIMPGQQLVIIGNDYSRTLFRVPNVDSVKIWTRGLRDSIWIYPGVTHRVREGNVLSDFSGNTFINPNAYDGIDNNFNGLIDENYFVHYHQIKRSGQIELINLFRPLRYVNYVTGQGGGATSMIDERRDDLVDNNNDWSRDRANGILRFDPEGNLIDDVGRDGIQNTNDFGERDGFPTSGYDALGNDTGLPGEPHIDKTDVNESDQIGLTSFYYFEPSGDINLADKDSLWGELRPGAFAVPENIQFSPGAGTSRPTRGSDGDFIWGTGFFPLLAGKTERFSLALVYGGGQVGGNVDGDIADLLKNKQTVQKIYNANYQFPTPPEKPAVTAVTSDRKVTLYWDRRSEDFTDPVLHIKTFEGYKVYRSTDPNFSDIFTITDASGIPQGYRPLAQFDLKDGITGNFQATGDLFVASNGYAIYLGNDSGVQHSFVDSGDIDNGRRYYYAVVAYTKGDNTLGIFPAENTKLVSIAPTGEVTTDINVVAVVPNAKVAGYVEPGTNVPLNHTRAFGTGNVFYKVVDETRLNAHTYQVGFVDTEVDSLDYNGNIIRYSQDSTQWSRITKSYYVRDMSQYSEQFSGRDTFLVYLLRKNIIPSSVSVLDPQGVAVPAANYRLDPALGTIRGTTHGNIQSGVLYTVKYNYYPVFRSPYIAGSPYVVETKDADIFDGVQLSFNNFWTISKVDSTSGWVGPSAYLYSFAPLNTNIGDITYLGYRSPNDYEIQFAGTIVDTSTPDPDIGAADPIPVNFRIFNRTDSTYMKFDFFETNPVPGSTGKLSPGDDIVILERNPRGTLSRTWDMFFSAKQGDPIDTVYPLTTGDKLVIKTTKPLRNGDQFEFTTVPPKIDNDVARGTLDRIKVVPNPYVTASAFELPLPPAISAGRGERKIDFIHLPVGASIKIFTARGDHVITLYHEGNIEDGTVSWNLKTKENLDIAYGVYFYVVESPVGNKTGKIAIIK